MIREALSQPAWPSLSRYFRQDIWRPLRPDAGLVERAARRLARALFIIVRSFKDDQVLLQSSSLTYMTLFSLVPFLALVFSIAKGLGLQSRLDEDFFSTMAAGQRDVARWIVSYVEATNVAALGTIGLVIVLYTVADMLGSIEGSFNHIWGVAESRRLHRKFADYVAVMLFVPLLVIASTTLTASLSSSAFVQRLLETQVVSLAWNVALRVLPIVTIWLAFAFLYGFVPNTRVHARAALVGGVLAGTIWHGAQLLYINLQIGVANYSKLYGTFASLPIFLVWLRTSWIIVLLGAEISYAVQHEQTYHPPLPRYDPSIAMRERAALEFLIRITRRFVDGEPPFTAGDLAAGIDLPRDAALAIIETLVHSGLVARSAAPQEALLPALDLTRMPVGEVLLRFRHQGTGALAEIPHDVIDERLAALHTRLEEAFRQAGKDPIGGVQLQDVPATA